MGKSRLLKNILFILSIIVICLVVFFGYYFIRGEKNPLISIIEDMNENKEKENNKSKMLDNHNGIYTYKDDLNGTKFIYSGCSISSINYSILVMNDKFYQYKNSCMGTYLIEEGNTTDLDIKLDEEKNIYVIHHQDKDYQKDFITNNIVLNNDISKKLNAINLDNYELIIRETEFEGNYYDINANINGISSSLNLLFNKNSDGSFTVAIVPPRSKDKILYSHNIRDYNFLPKLYPYGKSVVALETERNQDDNSKFAHRINVVNEDGVIYSVKQMFPITIDNTVLTDENSVYIMFDEKVRYFRMFVGYDDKMCVENSASDNITYYEFKIDYNYADKNFSKPVFVKAGREKEGCSYINTFLGGN